MAIYENQIFLSSFAVSFPHFYSKIRKTQYTSPVHALHYAGKGDCAGHVAQKCYQQLGYYVINRL